MGDIRAEKPHASRISVVSNILSSCQTMSLHFWLETIDVVNTVSRKARELAERGRLSERTSPPI